MEKPVTERIRSNDYRSRRGSAVILILLGSFSVLLAAALPLLLEAPILGFLLMGLPPVNQSLDEQNRMARW